MKENIELAKKILSKKYFINGDNRIRTNLPIRVEDLAHMMQDYMDEQLRICRSVPDSILYEKANEMNMDDYFEWLSKVNSGKINI